MSLRSSINKHAAYQNIIGNLTNAYGWIIIGAEEMRLIQPEGLTMSDQIGAVKTLDNDFARF